MTIAALRALLDQELPHVRRPPAPPHRHRRPLPSKDPAMDTPTARPTTTPPAAADLDLPDKHLAELLAWASWHDDPTVVAQGEQARAVVSALTDRRKRDAELDRIATEATELEKRLAELRAREAELQPPSSKKSKPQRDYDPPTVRAWARDQGLNVPDRGHIPNAILTAWRQRHTGQARAAN
jgi:hypothetical protein